MPSGTAKRQPESQRFPQLPALASTGAPCVMACHRHIAPAEAQAGADPQSRRSPWLRLFTHSTVNVKESGMSSAGDGNRVSVGLRCHNSEETAVQLEEPGFAEEQTGETFSAQS